MEIQIIKEEDVMPKNETAKKCSPHLVFENGSCIPLDLLKEMAQSYNKYHSNNKDICINLNVKTDDDNLKKYLLSEFQKRFKSDQQEWIKSEYLKLMSSESKEILENKVFRPDGPQGRFDWLSTIDINQVLYQYEEKYKDFKFLGAVPIDFMELDYLPFKKLKFEELENEGINKFGIIFNTDNSRQSGKHWISLFCNLNLGQVYFSDSVGLSPPIEVQNYIKKIEEYFKKKNIEKIDSRYNKTQHQRGNSECGVYSINFILRLLKGKTFDHITNKILKDNKINKCRIRYFTKVKPF